MLQLSNPKLFREACLVGGAWATAASGEAMAVHNPADGSLVGRVPQLSGQEIEAAIAAANAAYKPWAAKAASERAKILEKWYNLVVASADDLARILTTEQGKPLAEAKGEILYAASFLKWFSEEARRVYGDVIPAPTADKRLIVIKQPVGVCAAITPWNFPAAMITRKAGPALAAGCAMIVRPAAQTPFSALALGELAVEAGVPAGVSPTTDDLDPTPKPEGTGWKIVEGSPDRVQVLCDDPPGSGQRGTTPYLSVVRRDEKRGEGGCAWLVLSPQDAADSTNGVAVLTARIRVPSTNAYLADIDAFDDQPEGFHKRAFHVRFSPKGVVSYYDSEKEQPIAGVTIKPDTWQQVVIRADLRTATFDLTIEGQKATGLPFTHPDVHRLQSISFGPNTSKCALFVSSVKLEITP
jgi:hypothetical protein